MAVKLTDQQMLVVKGMEQFAEGFANQMLHIMQNHGLDQVKGFRMSIEINPKYDLVTKTIEFGDQTEGDAGFAAIVGGKRNGKYSLLGKNSEEYEWLFADDAVRSRMAEILHREDHVPVDSVRIRACADGHPVDGRWGGVNDKVS